MPLRDGIRLSYEQFKRFQTFMNNQLNKVFPSFKTHVFKCDRGDHVAENCDICVRHGYLPLEKQINRIMGSG